MSICDLGHALLTFNFQFFRPHPLYLDYQAKKPCLLYWAGRHKGYTSFTATGRQKCHVSFTHLASLKATPPLLRLVCAKATPSSLHLTGTEAMLPGQWILFYSTRLILAGPNGISLLLDWQAYRPHPLYQVTPTAPGLTGTEAMLCLVSWVCSTVSNLF